MKMFNVKQREIVIYVAIMLYCVALFLKRVNMPLDHNVLNKIMTLGAMLSVANIVFDSRFSFRRMILTVSIVFLLFLDSVPTGNHEILYWFIMIWGCRNIDNERLIRYIFKIVLVMTILIAVGTVLGIVDNELFIQNGTRYRYGLGYTPWSILPFQFFSLCMMYICLKKKNIPLLYVFGMSVLAIVIGLLTDTKTSIVITIFGVFVLYFLQNIEIKNWRRLKIMTIFPSVLVVMSFLLTYLYNQGNAFVAKLNIFLNYRIMFQSIGISKYGIGLWANWEANTAVSTVEEYYGIDNQFISLAVNWGLVALVFVVILYTWVVFYLIKIRNKKLLFFVLLMLCMAMMWSRLLVLIEAGFVVCFSDVFSERMSGKLLSTNHEKEEDEKGYAKSAYNG
ncbi:MAG: hypothetical protein IJZ42_05500 [Lachnospiraceae bacterium]|nr:hypothetical protein [Lachnospiraceae bacterium]